MMVVGMWASSVSNDSTVGRAPEENSVGKRWWSRGDAWLNWVAGGMGVDANPIALSCRNQVAR